jgi:HSP20 family protein
MTRAGLDRRTRGGLAECAPTSCQIAPATQIGRQEREAVVMADIVKKVGHPQQTTPARPVAGREWNPWQRMRELMAWDPFQEMSRYWPSEAEVGFVPHFEVRETNEGFVFKADLPGIHEDDLDINLNGNRLTISGKREAEQRNESDRYYAYEVQYGSFTRSFTLPDGVDPDHVKADLKNGVLTLLVPKKAEAQPRKIAIGGGARSKA